MNDLLERWAERSRQSKSLAVKFERLDLFAVIKTTKVYRGEARFRHEETGDLAYLHFDEIVKGQPVFIDRIVCNGQQVVHIVNPSNRSTSTPCQSRPRRGAGGGPLALPVQHGRGLRQAAL